MAAFRFLGGLVLLVLAASGPARAASPPLLLPLPASYEEGSGSFVLSGAVATADPGDRGAVAALDRLRELLTRSGGPVPGAKGGGGTIRFVRDKAVAGDEAYRLDVTPHGITVAASGDAGLFYGAETLWQLAVSAPGGRIGAIHIDDRPTFAWRGLMIDSARHFQPVAFIERQLDRMAVAKLNTFHWHLTDDQGWRLQIDRYPRLTEFGAWRTESVTGQRYGGFYTKADVRRVVAYAAARHITVVPEIEMPGHATALIAAYPQLAATPDPAAVPSGDWGVLPNLVNPDETTLTFMENVLDEVMELFPGQMIHVGGDEALKTQWQANPQIQAQIKALGLKDENALQGWFTARIADYLNRHGRRLVGWDEILEGAVPEDAVVMSWRGMDGAIAAAKAGHDTVLAPAPVLYLDNRQSDADAETPGRGDVVDWQRIYAFETQPAALTEDERNHILGIQANLWTEHATTTEYVERMVWPRAAMVAELGWTPAAARNWAGLTPRLLATLARWDRLDWAWDRVPLTPQMRIEGRQVTLRQPAGIGTLRYTLDGSAPTPASPAYVAPLAWNGTMTLAARAFLDSEPVGPAAHWTVDEPALRTRLASDLPLCTAKLPLRLVGAGGAIHWADIMNPCWRWPAAPVDGAAVLEVDVAKLPFNFALGHDVVGMVMRKPATPEGELEVRQDTCDGPLIGTLPLAALGGKGGRLSGRIAPTVPGPHDLCLQFTRAAPDPLWVIDRVTIGPAR